jgi:excisionase family DNA binding protein
MGETSTGRMRQLIRCHRILDCLSGRRIGYNASHLAEELGYTTKTIYRDLGALRGAGVHIWYDARARRYCVGRSPVVDAYRGHPSNGTAEKAPGVGDIRVGLREAARYLGVSPRRLKELIAHHEVPVARNGRRVSLQLKDLMAFKRAQRAPIMAPTAAAARGPSHCTERQQL